MKHILSLSRTIIIFFLFFALLSSNSFASHYYLKSIANKAVAFQDSGGSSGGDSSSSSSSTSSSTDSSSSSTSTGGSYDSSSGSYSGGSYSGGSYDSSGSYTGTGCCAGGSYTGSGSYSGSGGYDSSTGSSGYYSGGTYYSTGSGSGGTTAYDSSYSSSTATNADGSTSYSSTWEGGSSTTTTVTNPDGSTSQVYSYSYTDPTTGQVVTTQSTSTTSSYVDPVTGATVSQTSYTSTYVNPQTGQLETSTSSSSYSNYVDATGATVYVSSSESTYYDPVTGEQKTSTYTSESITDASGKSISTSSGDWGSSSYTYDPVSGKTTSESTWSDPISGETRTSKSESTSKQETDPETGAITYIYESKYDSYDPQTGERTEYNSYSSSKSVTNPDGTTTYVSENKYTDYATGQDVVSKTESKYDPITGSSISVTKTTNPETGEEYESSRSESRYDSETGESESFYSWVDPQTGVEYTSESTTTKDEDGNYVNTYRYTDSETGETRETPYWGVFGNSGNRGNAYTYSDESGSYTYYYDGSPPEDVHSYIAPDGSTYVYTDTATEQNALADAYGETFAAVLDSDLPVGIVEHDLLDAEKEAGTVTEEGTVTRELVGEAVISYTDYVDQIKAHADRELTDTERALITHEYENFEERLIYGEEHPVDVAPETYNEYTHMYDQYNIEEKYQLLPEDFEERSQSLDEFYAQRDALRTREDFSPEQRAAEHAALEREFKQNYEEQFGKIETIELPPPGIDDGSVWPVPKTILPALDTDSIDIIVADRYKEKFESLKEQGIPENHPTWLAYVAQVEAERQQLLDEQEVLFDNVIVAGCQGSVGGGSETCGKKVEIIETLVDGCASGEDACNAAAQVIAMEFKPETCTDKSSCLGEATRIVSELPLYADDPITQDAWLYTVEITPEKTFGDDLYREYRGCSGEGSCTDRYTDRFNEYITDHHHTWRAEYESLTPEQRDELQEQSESRRDEYSKAIEPEITAVRNELSPEEKAVFDAADAYLTQAEDRRLALMRTFRDTAEIEGHDSALLDYYIEEFEQSLDGCKEEIAHEDYIGMNGNLYQSREYFNLFMDEAREIRAADSAGTSYEAPQKLEFEASQ